MVYLDLKAIRLAMARNQLTVKNVAERAGMTCAGLYRIFARGSCRCATAGKLAVALGVPVIEIVTEEMT